MPSSSVYDGLPSFAGARNVAGVSRLMAKDIRTGSRKAPGLADAVRLSRLRDAVAQSAG